MNCPLNPKENAEVLMAYVARELDGTAAARMEEHVGACAACGEFVAGQRKVWEALDGWEPQPVSTDFNRRLYARIENEASWRDRVRRWLQPAYVRHGLPLAAAAALLVVAGIALRHPAAPQTAPANNSAQVETLQPEQVEHALDDMETLSQFNHLMRPEAPDSKM